MVTDNFTKPLDLRAENVYRPQWWVIRKIWKESHDTFSMMLNSQDNSDLKFLPGQFNMIYHFGAGEVPISISGDPDDSETLTHTIRAVGGVTKAMMALKKYDTVGIRGPYGTAWPMQVAEGQDVVILCGGIGLAPLRPALLHLLRHRDRYGKILLLYGARTPEDMLYVRELEKWRARFDMHVSVTVDRAGSAWRGNVGVVTALLRKFTIDGEQTTVMICGPEIMMRFTAHELLHRNIPAENIYVSMERRMECGVGLCGHCQWGPTFVCKDGPVYRYDRIQQWLTRREL